MYAVNDSERWVWVLGVYRPAALPIRRLARTYLQTSVKGGVPDGSGGGGIYNSGTATLRNTLIANSTGGGDCVSNVTLSNSNNNLIEDSNSACGLTNGSNGNIIGSDPNLGALTGSPAYFPLLPGSPAIDAGDNTTWADPPVNNQSQNGVIRPQDGNGDNFAVCDMGSYEYPDTPPALLPITRAHSNPTSSNNVNFTVTFSEPVTGVDVNDFTATVVSGAIGAVSVATVSGSDSSYTVTANLGYGNGTLRLDVPASATIADLGGNALSGLPYQSGEVYTVKKRLMVLSSDGQEGWVLESSETSNLGGSKNDTGETLFVGDDAQDRQYRAILSFDTAPLPNNAVIVKVTLRLKLQGVVGTDPFTTHGNLLVDVRKGAFSNNGALPLSDFQAAASKSAVGGISKNPVDGWHRKGWTSGIIFSYINKTGLTQFRLRFAKDDSDDLGADYLKFYSGDAGMVSRPQLIIEYYVP